MDKLEKILFTPEGEDEPAAFYVLEQTRIGGFNYILVTDKEEGDAEAFILKEVSVDENGETTYEEVEDENELEGIVKIFEELFDDIDFEM